MRVMAENLVGPLLYIVSSEDPGAGARLVKEFIKSNDRLVAKVIAFSGEVRPGEDLNVLAGLPTLDEAVSIIITLYSTPNQFGPPAKRALCSCSETINK